VKHLSADAGSTEKIGGTFSRLEWLLAVALVLLTAIGILYASYSISYINSQKRFEADSNMALRNVGERVVEINGVMKAMLGMHYASDEFAGTDIEAFAEQTRRYSPFVRGLGLYGVIEAEMRSEYEGFASSNQNQEYRIHTYNSDGASLYHESSGNYLPIISIATEGTMSQGFLGTDLAQESTIVEALINATDAGGGILLPVPRNWPIDSTAILLQPVYYAEQPPQTVAERRELHGGGIWVGIDIQRLFVENIVGVSGTLRFELASNGSPAASVLTKKFSSKGDNSGVSFGIGSENRSWNIGDTTLTASVTDSLYAPQQDLAIAIVAALLGTMLAVAIIGVFYQRRIAEVQKSRTLEVIKLERENAERTLGSISDAVISGFKTLQRRLADEEKFTIDARMCESQVDVPSQALCTTYELTFTRLSSGSYAGQGYIYVLQDVSKEREFTSELERRAHHDSLTGCYNRFYFERYLAELLEDVPNSGRRHALCYIDLDQFKIVNDTAGHTAGDRLLCELTTGLQKSLRDTDVLARLGGDEFGIIIVDAAPQEAHNIAERVFSWFQNAVFEHEGQAFPVRGSLGLVDISVQLCDMQQIMAAADIACYTAKDGGRNCLVVYSEDNQSMANRQEEMNWAPVLERAIANDDFELLVQPIIKTAGHKAAKLPLHYEFLLRLRDENGDLVAPGRFIAAAERYDLMRSIDRLVVDKGFALVKKASQQLPADCVFSLNLSGQSAADPEVLGYIEERFQHHSVAPQKFWFEITETAAISQFANAVKLIEGIRQLGAKVALDDFGSGLSSFAYLRELPIDVLKIDGQFVKDCAVSEVAREMVKAIHHVAKTMQVETVAEFVEDQAVLDVLEKIKVTYAQGYFIGKPVAFESIIGLEIDKDAA